MTTLEKYVFWTHIYQPLITPIKDTNSSYYGKYWILTDNEDVSGIYLSFEELVEFWNNNPYWKENIVKRRLNTE